MCCGTIVRRTGGSKLAFSEIAELEMLPAFQASLASTKINERSRFKSTYVCKRLEGARPENHKRRFMSYLLTPHGVGVGNLGAGSTREGHRQLHA